MTIWEIFFKRVDNLIVQMNRFTPSEPLFKDSKEIDNYVLYNFGKKPASGQIKQYWLSIAKMYFSVGNYSMTTEFLFRLILISPQNYEVNSWNKVIFILRIKTFIIYLLCHMAGVLLGKEDSILIFHLMLIF